MRLLLDTSVVVRTLLEPERLSSSTAAILVDPSHTLVVSVVSAWEIGIKIARGKLTLDAGWVHVLREGGNYEMLPVLMEHALAAPRLPLHYHDPFDRMLIAQALVEELTLVSTDRAFALYNVPLILA